MVFKKGNKYVFKKGHYPTNGFKKGEHSGTPFQKGERLGIKPLNGFKKGNKIGNRFEKGNKYAFKRGHNKGIPKSEEIKGKISIALKGLHPSEESKRKMSISQKGNTNGCNITEENKLLKNKKISIAKKGKPSHSSTKFKKGENMGINNNNYKGGITPINKLIRSSSEYREWRKKVFNKNNFTCQKCKDNKGGNLVAHHIQNFYTNPELRFIIDNGITLCVKCHNEFHTLYGTKHNNQEQLTEFLNE